MNFLASEDLRNIPFDFKTYQKTEMFQFLQAGYSLWYLMNKYFEAKEKYYHTGNSPLTDSEFDALERTIIVKKDKEFLERFGCVGYNRNNHIGAKSTLSYFKNEIYRRFTKPHNEYAASKHGEVIEIKPVIIQESKAAPRKIEVDNSLPDIEVSVSDSGQLYMVI